MEIITKICCIICRIFFLNTAPQDGVRMNIDAQLILKHGEDILWQGLDKNMTIYIYI